jgi:hypothetical protein
MRSCATDVSGKGLADTSCGNPVMTEPTRRMTLLDAMILIAATAGGLAMIRGPVPGVLHILPSSPPIPFLIPRPALDAGLLTLAAWPLPAMWTLALLTIRLRPPRPPWRRLSRQPGVTACCAVAFVALFNTLLLAGLSLKVGFDGDLFPVTALPVGLAVAVTWATLRMGGRWRPVPSPLDRAGRLLGAYWVAMIPLSFVVALSVFR